jgi:hypothetical protein
MHISSLSKPLPSPRPCHDDAIASRANSMIRIGCRPVLSPNARMCGIFQLSVQQRAKAGDLMRNRLNGSAPQSEVLTRYPRSSLSICSGAINGAAFEYAGLFEQLCETARWPGRCIQSLLKRVPLSFVQIKTLTAGQCLFGSCKRTFQNEFTERSIHRRSGGPQNLLCGRRQSHFELLVAGFRLHGSELMSRQMYR